MSFSAAALRAALHAHVPAGATGLALGLSGGADSAGLLIALQSFAEGPFRALPLRALHVNHGLQPAAVQFEHACTALCAAAGVALEVLRVTVDIAPGSSLEAAARDARYVALARALQAGECLLTAHHARDQAETWLLQSLRGAGLKGLSAMPACRPLGAGWHVRPLLDVTRDEVRRFAAATAVHDPMNDDPRFDRAYLRTQVWPALERRWPGAEITLARAARHLAGAQASLDRASAALLERLRDGDAVSVPGLRALGAADRLAVLRHWIAAKGITPPSTARLKEGWRQIADAGADHLPAVAWGDHALRRYRDRLFVAPAATPALGARREWQHSLERMKLGDALGSLRTAAQAGGLDGSRLPDTLTVRQRQGGETLKPTRGARTRSLPHLCQEFGVLPWMRDVLPLIFAGDALIAVGDLWLAAGWCVAPGAAGRGIVWEEAPIIA